MTGTVIDGKAVAAELRSNIAKAVASLKSAHGLTPGLAVVLVGEDPASQVYVRNKAKQTVETGMASCEHKLDAATPEVSAARTRRQAQSRSVPCTAFSSSCRCPNTSIARRC